MPQPQNVLSKVEKLNTAQQLMAMIIHPPELMWCWMKRIAVSSVRNQNISHIIALTLDDMSVMNMAILSWTVHTEYLLQKLQQHTTNNPKVNMPDWVQGTTMKIETVKANPGHSPTIKDIVAQVIMIHVEVTLDHSTRMDTATTGAAHDDLTQPTEVRATDLAMTHHTSHITDYPNIEAFQVINPDITGDHIHDHPTNLQDIEVCWSDSYSSRVRRSSHPKKNMKVKTEDPHSDYYSSNDHFSKSGGDSDPFKLIEPSLCSDSYELVGLPSNDQVMVALITDCPMITAHPGKCYKALIDSGAAISLIRYSMYQTIDRSFKTPIQATKTKLNTADGQQWWHWE